MEYKTLEQKIIELWASIGLKVRRMTFRATPSGGVWTIEAEAQSEDGRDEA